MTHAAIINKGENGFTKLNKVFDSIKNEQLNYNWLITDCECYPDNIVLEENLKTGYCWLTGEELTKLVQNDSSQWIWAVLSAFPKQVTLEQVLKYPLPFANGYGGFWQSTPTMQHPLAKIELVAWDSSLTLIFSEDEHVIDNFKAGFALSEDLVEYNKK